LISKAASRFDNYAIVAIYKNIILWKEIFIWRKSKVSTSTVNLDSKDFIKMHVFIEHAKEF
jgi:hypothetical protein